MTLNGKKEKETAWLLSKGYKVLDADNFQVKIPDCCRNGGIIKNRSGSEEPCPHVVKRIKAKRGNVGL